MTPITIERHNGLHELRAAVRGSVHAPGDDGYDAARAAFNVAVDQRPHAIVEALDARGVSVAVRYAALHRLTVGGQAGGHGASHDQRGTVLVRTNELRSIAIDTTRETARVGAGVRWADLMAVAGEHGLLGLAGSAPDVSVVGYMLGGGVSWFGRKYGYAARHAIEFEVVGADGEVRAVNASTDPELFWALRGGGGNFGIVTAVELQLHPAPALYGGQLIFDVERAADVLRAFAVASGQAPVETSLTASVTNVPPLPGIPEAIQGRSIVHVGLVHQGDGAQAERLLAGIRAAGGEPIMDVMRPLTVAEIGTVAMDPEDPMPARHAATMVDRIDDSVIDAVLGHAGPGSPLVMVQIRHLGGALSKPDLAGGACGHLDGEFLIYGVGVLAAPELAEAVGDTLGDLRAALAHRRVGRLPLTFVDDASELDVAWGQARPILADVKCRRDPDGLFRANHAI